MCNLNLCVCVCVLKGRGSSYSTRFLVCLRRQRLVQMHYIIHRWLVLPHNVVSTRGKYLKLFCDQLLECPGAVNAAHAEIKLRQELHLLWTGFLVKARWCHVLIWILVASVASVSPYLQVSSRLSWLFKARLICEGCGVRIFDWQSDLKVYSMLWIQPSLEIPESDNLNLLWKALCIHNFLTNQTSKRACFLLYERVSSASDILATVDPCRAMCM